MFKKLAVAAAVAFPALALADGLPPNLCSSYLDAGAPCYTCTHQCGTCVPVYSGASSSSICTLTDGGATCPAGTPTMQCSQAGSTSGSSSGGSSGGTGSGASGGAASGATSTGGAEGHTGGCATGAGFGPWLLAGLPLLLLSRRRRR